jgi:hypothetical protein
MPFSVMQPHKGAPDQARSLAALRIRLPIASRRGQRRSAGEKSMWEIPSLTAAGRDR